MPQPASSSLIQGSGFVGDLHRREDVQEHPRREELPDLRPVGAGDAADVGDEVAEALADDAADVGILRRRVALHLGAEPDAVRLELLHVGGADRLQRLLAPQALGGALEELERVAVAAADGRDVELLLRPEEAEEVRLGDARPLRDVLGRGALEARGRRTRSRAASRIVSLRSAAERRVVVVAMGVG